ncbi:MAG: hypothetical protein M3O46_22885, partial [Myxococcota bacterium]|nr:hypothetical protein [Myxococcota bacterium]
PPLLAAIDVEPGNALTLVPGSHGSVVVKSRATINLQSGTYYMLSFDLEAQIPPTSIQARARFSSMSTMASFTAAHSSTHSTARAICSSDLSERRRSTWKPSLEASVVAPSAQLVLGTVPPPTFTDEFFAKDIQVLPGVIVSGQSFNCP